jgi:acetyltransferase
MTQQLLANTAPPDPAARRLESYPAALSRRWTLPSGESLRLRPIRHDDDSLEEAFVCGLSRQTAYQRMLGGGIKVTPEWIRSMTHIDYQRHMALVLTATAGGAEQFVAVGRYVVDPAQATAEFALVIADAWQGQGLGRRLLDALLDQAAEAGVETMEGIVLATNRSMLTLALSAGFTIEAEPDDATVVRVRRSVRRAGAQTH